MVTNLIIMEHTEDASAPANVPPASPSIAPLRNLTRQSSFSLATSDPPAGPPGPVDDGTPASPLAPLLGAREELSSKKRNLKPNNTGLKIAPAATPSEISNASEGGGGPARSSAANIKSAKMEALDDKPPPRPRSEWLAIMAGIATFVFLTSAWMYFEDWFKYVLSLESIESIEDWLQRVVIPLSSFAVGFFVWRVSGNTHRVAVAAWKAQWRHRTRFILGHQGLLGRGKEERNHTSDDDGSPVDETKTLASLDATAAFCEALLLYASHRWVNEDRSPPVDSMSLSLIDFGEKERRNGNGTTTREAHRELLFIPLDVKTAAAGLLQSAIIGEAGASPFDPSSRVSTLPSPRGGGDSSPGAAPSVTTTTTTTSGLPYVLTLGDTCEDGTPGRFSPLTKQGDIQLCIVPTAPKGEKAGGLQHVLGCVR